MLRESLSSADQRRASGDHRCAGIAPEQPFSISLEVDDGAAHRLEPDPLPLAEALTAALRTRRLPAEREADAKSGARFWLGLSERLNALGAALIGEPDPFWRTIERRRGALTDARRLSAEMRKLRRAGAQSEDEDLEPTDEELREIDGEADYFSS